ncbi:MAG: MFS transporter, partial [Gemmatimonadaceae bacterium]
LTLLLYAALGGSLFFLPFDLIEVHHYSPTAAGAALTPFAIILFALSRWAGGLITRYGARLPLVVGPAVAAAGFALFAVAGTGGSYWTTVFPAVVVLGVGMAIAVAPLTTTVMNAVDARRAGVASGVNNAVARTAGLLAVAVFGMIATHRFTRSFDGRLVAEHVPAAAREALRREPVRLADAKIPAGLDAEAAAAVHRAVAAAFTDGYREVMLLAAGLALAAALVAFLTIETLGDR